jgi:putative protein-disulfide isomerase
MTDRVSGLIYVGDPMCSWCWGFAPEIESLAGDHPVEIVVGGLRPGPMAQTLDERMALFLSHHWVEIAQRTGQPFDTGFLDRRDGWVYDTEPAAIAIVEMRETSPGETLSYFTAIQYAFYAEGRDVTDFSVLTEIARHRGIDPETFASALPGEDAKRRAWGDFSRARRWGIDGFPALVGDLGDGRFVLLARGWTDAATIRDRIRRVAAAS